MYQRVLIYDETILVIVSDHGLSATSVHIPLVEITRQHGFNPHCYPYLGYGFTYAAEFSVKSFRIMGVALLICGTCPIEILEKSA